MIISANIKNTYDIIKNAKRGLMYLTIDLDTMTVVGVSGDNPNTNGNTFLSAGVMAMCPSGDGPVFWTDSNNGPCWSSTPSKYLSKKYNSFCINMGV